MNVNITKMSPNGQIVIPAEIRKEGNIEPSTQFIVFTQDGNVLLKRINKEILIKDIELMNKIERAEEQIKKGKYTKAKTQMRDEEIDDLLMG